MTLIKRLAGCVAAAAVCVSGSAWGFGGLVTSDGPGVISATRAVVAHDGDEVRIVAQIRYDGSPASAVWLVPIPNSVMMGGEVAARAEQFGQGVFQALATATDPVFTGECDDMPTGMRHAVPQVETYGPAAQMLLPTRFFTVAELVAGDLTTYLDSVGLTADEAMQTAIADVIDQNYMIAAVRIDTAMLGVDRIAPVVGLRYPDAGSLDDVRLALRLLSPSVGAGPADVVLWLLGDGRARVASFQTDEIDYDLVEFTSPSETNYLDAFDMYVSTRQSQAFVVESAGPVDGGTFQDAELSGLIGETGASYLTRLHGRLLPIAIQSNLAVVGLQSVGGGDVTPGIAVAGFGCDAPGEDMGMTADVGPVLDEGVGPGDMGDEPALDASLDSDADTDEGGGGGSSGCLAAPGAGSLPGGAGLALLALLALAPLSRRRR